MKKFKVLLTRSYIVTIDAENKNQACHFSEFYLGDCPDISTSNDITSKNFRIDEIEMTYNEAYEPEEINDSQ